MPIEFKECEVHTMIRYAGDKCPVCVAIEAHDFALGRADYDKTQLEGRIADLETRYESGLM